MSQCFCTDVVMCVRLFCPVEFSASCNCLINWSVVGGAWSRRQLYDKYPQTQLCCTYETQYNFLLSHSLLAEQSLCLRTATLMFMLKLMLIIMVMMVTMIMIIVIFLILIMLTFVLMPVLVFELGLVPLMAIMIVMMTGRRLLSEVII